MTDPQTNNTPAVEIATLPPPIATIALPEIGEHEGEHSLRTHADRAGDRLEDRDDRRVRVEDQRDRGGGTALEPHVEHGRLHRVDTEAEPERDRALARRRQQRAVHRGEHSQQDEPGDAEADTERDTGGQLLAGDRATEQDRAAEGERAEQREREIAPVGRGLPGFRLVVGRATVGGGHQPSIAPAIMPSTSKPPARRVTRNDIAANHNGQTGL